MKSITPLTLRTFSPREILAFTTLASVAPLMGAEPSSTPPGDKEKKESSGAVLDEIVVKADAVKTYKTENLSSQKYTVPLRDVPQTVNVVPKQLIEEQGATSLASVLRNVPGITMQSGENGQAAVATGGGFTMRGFDTNNSIFVNGVRDVGYVTRDTFNLESVEAFQGPTGSDIGRGNGAGYINLQTKTPHLGNSYAGSLGYASRDRQRYTIDINQEIPENIEWLKGAAFRLNGLYQDGGVAGRDWVEKNVWGIAPSLAFGLGTEFRSTFSYQHIEEDNIPDYGIPSYLGRKLPGASEKWFYGNLNDHEDLTQDSFTARFEYDVTSDITIRNQTSYSKNSADLDGLNPQYSNSTGLVSFVRQTNGMREFEIFSNQTSVNAEFTTGKLKHALVGGIEYTKEKQDTRNYLTPTPAPVPPVAPSPIGAPWKPNPHLNLSSRKKDPNFYQIGETETIGAYLFDTVKFGEKWMLSGGLRVDSYDAEYKTRSTAGVVTGPVKTDDEIYSGKVALTYKPVEEGSVYVGYSATQTPPGTANVFEGVGRTGIILDEGTGNNSVNSDPQESYNVELGTKWDFFNSKLTLSSAIFHTENQNVIYTDPISGLPTDSGAQKVDGITFGATGRITDNWNIIANATWLDARIDQPNHAQDGNTVPRTPEFSGSLWTTYQLPKGFTIGAGVRYQGKTYVGTNNVVDIPAYVVFDGLVQYDVTENMNLRLNIYNLLDREYVATSGGGGGGGGGSATSGGHIKYGDPLSFAFSANFTF
ncbi:MAG: TonB-dependent siderophore receptor [Luteolibacter sp.]